jgi:hemerythrin-like domain-containing protein
MPRILVDIGLPQQSSFAQPLSLLSECHRRIERFLNDMAGVVHARRGCTLDDADRSNLKGAVKYFSTAAPKHTADEEESLFPRLRSAASEQLKPALEQIKRLESDHERADACHVEANALANRWLAKGILDSAAANRLAELLDTLTGIYRDHIAIEDTCVFPAANAALSVHELEAVGREMAARRGLDFDRIVGPRSGISPGS